MSEAPPPHHPHEPLPYATAITSPRVSGLAVAALVTGLLGIVTPLLGIVAIILGALGINRTRRTDVSGRGLAVAGLILGALGTLLSVLLLTILMPSLGRARETANRVKCASNMRQIGLAIALYANENGGAYPPDLARLIPTQALPPSVFTCPTSSSTAAPFTNDAAARAAGNLNYIYTGEGLTNAAAPDDPVIFEMISDHAGDGGNVLFGDGHVEFLGKGAYLGLVKKLAGTARLDAEESAAVNKP